MGYRVLTGPFTGDDDIADFILDVWLDFATTVGWIDQNAAARGTHPDQEFWVSKGSLLTPAAPYVFFRTTIDRLFIFTGDGVNTLQEIYDQPNNPMNCPSSSPESYTSTHGNVRCPFLNEMDGPFDNAWLFSDSDSDGAYIHCIIQTRTREFRHFHIGLLNPLHTDLDADSFYVTCHYWDGLRDGQEFGSQFEEHAPYSTRHSLPFRNMDRGVSGGSFRRHQMRSMFYVPNLGANPEDWYIARGSGLQTDGTQTPSSQASAIDKPIGDVNNASSSTFFGMGCINGYDSTMGMPLWRADKNFTSNFRSLIPIYLSCYTNFAAAIKQAPVAQIPDVYRVNMKEIDAGELITIGSDNYRCFPMINKDSANVLEDEGYSGYEGLAYKQLGTAV